MRHSCKQIRSNLHCDLFSGAPSLTTLLFLSSSAGGKLRRPHQGTPAIIPQTSCRLGPPDVRALARLNRRLADAMRTAQDF